jgi:hypothetical protein
MMVTYGSTAHADAASRFGPSVSQRQDGVQTAEGLSQYPILRGRREVPLVKKGIQDFMGRQLAQHGRRTWTPMIWKTSSGGLTSIRYPQTIISRRRAN